MNTICFKDGYDQELNTRVKHLQMKWMYRTCNTPTLKKILEVQRIIPNYRHGTMTIAASMPRDTPMSTRRCLFRLSVDCVDPKKVINIITVYTYKCSFNRMYANRQTNRVFDIIRVIKMLKYSYELLNNIVFDYENL